MHVYQCIIAMKIRRRLWVLRNRSYRQLGATMWVLRIDLDLLQEQPVFLTTEPSLQSQEAILRCSEHGVIMMHHSKFITVINGLFESEGVWEAHGCEEHRVSAFLSTLLEPKSALEKPGFTSQLSVFCRLWRLKRGETRARAAYLMADYVRKPYDKRWKGKS